MNHEKRYYVFVVGEQMGCDGCAIPSSHVFKRLAANSRWFLSTFTPFRDKYKPGDQVLFYLAGPKHRYFAGRASVAVKPLPASQSDLEMLAQLGLFGYEVALPLSGVVLFRSPRPMRDLVGNLEFIKDKKNYGLNLRQGAIRISRKDYDYIVREHA